MCKLFSHCLEFFNIPELVMSQFPTSNSMSLDPPAEKIELYCKDQVEPCELNSDCMVKILLSVLIREKKKG